MSRTTFIGGGTGVQDSADGDRSIKAGQDSDGSGSSVQDSFVGGKGVKYILSFY